MPPAPAAGLPAPSLPAPPSAAAQVAAALPRATLDGAPLEVALDPPELGRVRLSIAETGGVVQVTILADRPETADLMRRHLDVLMQEFARAGLDAPQVRVGQQGGGGQGPADHAARPEGTAPDASPTPNAPPPPAPVATGRLDLRL